MPTLTVSKVEKRYPGLWTKFTTGSTNRRVFRAVVTIATLASVAKLAAVAKELLVARRFGTGSTIEAFLVAILIPLLAVNIVSGSFNIALIPTYISAREKDGREAAQRLLSGASLWSLLLLILVTVTIVVTGRLYLPWIASGFNQRKLDLTFQLLWVVSPLVVLSGVANIWGAVLNAGERFALVALAPVITPTITVIVLLIKRDTIFALPVGLVIGAGLEMIVLGIALKLRGISLRPRWHGFEPNLRQVGQQFGPRMGANLLRSGSIVVDRSLAAMLPPGSVATLNYGNRVTVTVLSVAGAALGSAIAPYYSKMIAREDWHGVRHTLKRYLVLMLVGSIPIVIVLFVVAAPIIQVLFQRGSFQARDTELVAHVQALYALQIPFYLGNILISRLLFSLLASRVTLWAAAINLTLNIVLDVLFIRVMGVAGIALATSCASLVTFCFVAYHSVRLLRENARNSAQSRKTQLAPTES